MTWIWFALAAAAVVVSGSRLAADGAALARRFGLSTTWAGTVLAASVTSLPELVSGVSAAGVHRLPDIAVGDVLGSCMFNLLLLTLLDVASGPRTLASRVHQGHLLTLAFGVVLAAVAGYGIHASHLVPRAMTPLTPVALAVVYVIAARTIHRADRVATTRPADEAHATEPVRRVAARFGAAAAVLVAAALVLPPLASDVASATGLGLSVVGVAVVAVVTSLPEASVSFAALRRGDVDFAYGNLVGSNVFNFLILAIDDLAYGPGSLLRDASPVHTVPLLAVVAMSAVGMAGLCVQSLRKAAVLAWDTLAILAIYVVTLALMLAEAPAGAAAAPH